MADRSGAGKVGKWGRWPHWLLMVSLTIATTGCTRRFFRERADDAVAKTLEDKDRYPAWAIEQYHVYPDSRARFADPTNPDRPPMPPDDPAAHDLSPNPQKPGKAGIGRIEGVGYLELMAAWDAENRAALDEPPPDPPAPTSAADCRSGYPFLLTLEQACELGLINSREFQDRREDLYLTALPVTLERFAFCAQPFAAEQAIREATGRNTPEGQHNRARFNSDLGFTKLFTTGALLLLRVANQTAIEFGPNQPRHVVSQSILTLDAIQPLLRGGGRAVTLEPLTQVERSLLYEIRNYARFRKEFFAFLTAGGDFGRVVRGGASPVRTPLNATLVGIPTGDIARPLIPIGSGVRPVLPTAIGAPSEGYLPALLIRAQLQDQRENVVELEKILKLFDAYKEGGDISQLQVDRVEQQLLQGRTSVLQAEQGYRDAVDNFKLQLGVPTDLPLELDDRQTRPLAGQLRAYRGVIDQFEQARADAERFDEEDQGLSNAVSDLLRFLAAPVQAPAASIGAALAVDRGAIPTPLPGRLRARVRRIATESPVVRGTRFRDQFLDRWAAWERLRDSGEEFLTRQRRLFEERRGLQDRKADQERVGKTLAARDNARLNELEFELELAGLERALREFEAQPWLRELTPDRAQRLFISRLRDVLNAYVLVLGEARNEKLDQIRGRWPVLPPVLVGEKDLLTGELDDALTVAGQTALTYRLDLMNERARLVDSWRQIAVLANALLGTLNVEYHLDSFTPPLVSRPLAFGGSGNRHQLILSGELPIVRVLERNNYRAGLIAFQRQRRELMEAEDDVLNAVRQEIRQLRQLAENYKIQKRAVELAYLQVENALETFQAPPSPADTRNAGNAAALTTQLLDAQSRVPSAQDQLFVIWLRYLTTRIQLYRDLELLPLDLRGVWTDELATLSRGANDGPARPESGAEHSDPRAGDVPLSQPRPVPPASPPRP
jgi:hypothetical protein